MKDAQIDTIAVAIGTAYGFYQFEPEINIDRLREIAAVIDEPIVLHGGFGTPREQVIEAINNGIAKVNICTELIVAFGKAHAATQGEPGFRYNVPSMFGQGKTAAYALTYDKMKLFLTGKPPCFAPEI